MYKQALGDHVVAIAPWLAPSGPGLKLTLATPHDGEFEHFFAPDGTGQPGSAVALAAILPVFHAAHEATRRALMGALDTPHLAAVNDRQGGILIQARPDWGRP